MLTMADHKADNSLVSRPRGSLAENLVRLGRYEQDLGWREMGESHNFHH